MATIKIKGRTDPLRIPNDRARKLKERWLGDPNRSIEKAPRTDIIDLGDWCGEYGQIASIELDKAPPSEHVDDQHKEDERIAKENVAWLKQTPEQKALSLEKFKISFKMRHGFTDPTQEQIDRAHQIQIDYYRAHPTELWVPNEAFGDLLPPSRSSLSDRMKINS